MDPAVAVLIAIGLVLWVVVLIVMLVLLVRRGRETTRLLREMERKRNRLDA